MLRKRFTSSLVRNARKFSTDAIEKVGVVGLGLMGHGIAQVSAQAGYTVSVVESNPEALAKGMARIDDRYPVLAAHAARSFRGRGAPAMVCRRGSGHTLVA